MTKIHTLRASSEWRWTPPPTLLNLADNVDAAIEWERAALDELFLRRGVERVRIEPVWLLRDSAERQRIDLLRCQAESVLDPRHKVCQVTILPHVHLSGKVVAENEH